MYENIYFLFKENSHTNTLTLANLYVRIYVFSLHTVKDRALCFSTKKNAVRVVFKCKLYLKNSIKLIKKFFAAAQVNIFFVTRISGNKSIIFFGLKMKSCWNKRAMHCRRPSIPQKPNSWLSSSYSPSPISLLHNDYKCDNYSF